jgi:hypothetical protein
MLIYAQHHFLIAMLERYMSKDLFPDVQPPHLNASPSLGRVKGLTHELGFFAQTGLIASPLAYGIVYWYRNRDIPPPDLGLGNVVSGQLVNGVGLFFAASFAIIFLVALYGYLRRLTLRA